MRSRPYSDWLWNICGLIGVPFDRITTTNSIGQLSVSVADLLNALFNGNFRRAWDTSNWTDICPKGEARFCGNLLTYPNDLSKTANWTATNLTITGNSIPNPADNRTTASKLAETVTTGVHKAVQGSISFFPGQQYQVSAYARPFGTTNWIYFSVSDGSSTFTSFFNVYTGVVGTSTGVNSTSIQQCANGFFLCTILFNASASATTGSVTVQTSSNGTTLSYAGTITNGLYVWGVLALQQTAISPQIYTVPWNQTGENEIETIFSVWKDNPYNASYPRSQGYLINDIGVQMISSLGWDTGTYGYTGMQGNPANPTYIYYRKAYKFFTGVTFDATATYGVGQQIYYTIATTTASDYGTSDFYVCLVVTTAGQDPEDTPNSWQKISLPEVFFDYLLYQTYGDYLISDGQMDKSKGAYVMAEVRKLDELDRQERQNNDLIPMQVNTHITSQSRY